MDISKLDGIFDANAVKEISLFESIMSFFREAGASGRDYDEFTGLNDTFIHSYCSMLDFIYMELFQDDNLDRCLLVESSSLLVILKYLRVVFEKLSSKKCWKTNHRKYFL